MEQDGLRIATDLVERNEAGEIVSLQPMHAEVFPSGKLHWRKHREGAPIPAIPTSHIAGYGEYKKFWMAHEDELLALSQ